MEERHIEIISGELNLTHRQIHAVADLLEEGGTVPFIASYPKEATGSMDEVNIMVIRDRLARFADLSKRREAT